MKKLLAIILLGVLGFEAQLLAHRLNTPSPRTPKPSPKNSPATTPRNNSQ